MTFPLLRISSAALAAAALAGSLAGCAPLVIGGGAVGGTLMATDRRTTGTQVEDEGIEMRTASRIRETLGDRVHVNVRLASSTIETIVETAWNWYQKMASREA